MNTVTIRPLEIGGHSLHVAWDVQPPSALYRRTEFTMRFPDSIDLAGIPGWLWWFAVMACLHSHWMVLRPCRIELPVTLPQPVAEFWLRLLDGQIASLEVYRGTGGGTGGIAIECRGAPLADPTALADNGRCATAFSSGKDSLLQAGLLAELTEDPVLVTTTSPMPPLQDHLTARRRHVLNQIVRRRRVTLVEVDSDFRSCWDNEFARSLGYPVAINELTDTHLYASALALAGHALGCTHLFMASETEVQDNVERNGAVVHNKHMMYSTAVQRAFDRLLRPAGLRMSSMTAALHSFQVQQLLWRRYPDLGPLQYSCWRVGEKEATCSACSQCLRVAMCCAAIGVNPRRMGVDLAKLFKFAGGWRPAANNSPDGLLPTDIARMELQSQLVRFVRTTPRSRAVRMLLSSAFAERTGPQALLSAWRGYSQLRRNCAAFEPGPQPGFRAGFLEQADELVRGRLDDIFRQYFEAEPTDRHAAIVGRSERAAMHIVEPLLESGATAERSTTT